jgi:threonine dehydratase
VSWVPLEGVEQDRRRVVLKVAASAKPTLIGYQKAISVTLFDLDSTVQQRLRMPADNRPPLPDIQAAADVVRQVVAWTPLKPLHSASGNDRILLKVETFQPVSSFKLRGVYHAVASLSDEERARGISTVSAGNTAQALAWCGQHFGVPARSVMPDTAPATKIEAVRQYGGEPVLVPMDEVFAYMKGHLWENEPYSFIHPWTDRTVMTGHASIGLEIVEDCPDVESVFVPVGGGGLLAGVGSALKALKPDVRIYAVEPDGCAAFAASLRQGSPAAVECETICDGVAVPYMTEEMFPLLRDLTDRVALVPDADTKQMVKRLAVGDKLVAEPSGALAAAAALQVPAAERGLTVCLLTGGSIDAKKLTAILEQ